jgi:predicted DNA-binding antitoxin AbrB/MazE fold protein
MLLEGHIENGVVVLNEPVSLPDGTPVRVEVVSAAPAEKRDGAEQFGHFLNHYKNVIGTVHDLPSDAALNHDHYLYGLPKK